MSLLDHIRSNTRKTETSAAKPFIIVGLGNPGAEYADTRHNLGFKVVDVIAAELGASYWKSKDGALVAECKLDGRQLVLVKPQSFMNTSGKPVKRVMASYGFATDELANLLVIQDELDLPDGELRLKRGGGHGGHRGILSIIESVGADFARLRIGVGRPPGHMEAVQYVLLPMKGEVLAELEASVSQAVPIALAVAADGLQAAMNKYNQNKQGNETESSSSGSEASSNQNKNVVRGIAFSLKKDEAKTKRDEC